MELKVLVAAARRGLVIILLGALLGAVGAALVRQTLGERYAASASLLLDPIAVLVPGRQPSFGDPERYVEAQLRLLSSAAIAERAAQSLPEHDGEEVREAISLTQVTGSDVVEVTARASSPEVASDMANALVTAYVELRAEEAAAARQAQVSAVEERIAELQAQLTPPDALAGAVPFDQQLLRDQLAEMQTQLNAMVVSDAVVDRTVVLDPATPPRQPERIGLPLVVVIGAMAGALVGLAVAAVREYRAPRVMGAAHTELLLGRPVAAEFAARRGPRRAKDGASRGDLVGGGLSQAALALASSVASAPAQGRRRQVCVSSAARDEGTLEVATALGAALVGQGAVVALVSLDHSTDPDTSVAAGDGTAEGARPEHEHPRWSAESPSASRLAVWRPRRTSDVLRIEDVHLLYGELPEDCDVVVLHTPPVLTSPLGAQIARESDELVLVVQVGTDLETDLTRAAHALRSAGADPHPVTYRAGRTPRWG